MKILSSMTISSSDSGEWSIVDVDLSNGTTMRVRVFWDETIQDAVNRQFASN